MQAISNYLTVLQLGVGLNLVVGAYSSYRKNQEEYLQSRIDDARGYINEVLGPEVDIPAKFRSKSLDEGPVKELTDKELRRYLIDVSIRFDRRKRVYELRDGYVEPLLFPIGVLTLIALCYASLWPKTQVSYAWVYPSIAAGLLPATFSLSRLIWEVSVHKKYNQRSVNLSYYKVRDEGQDKDMKSSACPGEITRVINEIRIRYNEHLTNIKRGRNAK